MMDIAEVHAGLNQLQRALLRQRDDSVALTRLGKLADGVATRVAALKTLDPALPPAILAATAAVAAIDPAEHGTTAAALAALQTLDRLGAADGNALARWGFGWKRDLPDARDQIYSAPLSTLKALPRATDLRSLMPPVYDQAHLGSCTGNAIAACVQFVRRHAGERPDFVPSRLFIYYNERAIEDSVALDAGARIRDGLTSVARLGVCPEDVWPYDSAAADPATHLFPAGARASTPPDATAAAKALDHLAISYWSIVPTLAQLKACLADGFPFVLGFMVYRSFFDAAGQPKTTVDRPAPGEEIVGGHAVAAVGYDDSRQAFIMRNSWGPAVQDAGHFYMSYAYVTDSTVAQDFWTIRAVKS